MTNQFLPVFNDSKFKKLVYLNFEAVESVRIIRDEGHWLEIEFVLRGQTVKNLGYIMLDDWTEFKRTLIIGVPRRTSGADIHLGAIADELRVLSELVSKLKSK